MLNQAQSKTINRLKLLFIIPFLGLFLLGFNTKEVYITTVNNKKENIVKTGKGNGFNYSITKNTSNSELETIKKELEAKEVDFSFTTVRNNTGEIIDITLHASGKDAKEVDFDLSFNTNSNKPIEAILLSYDTKNQTFYIGKEDNKKEKPNSITTTRKTISNKKTTEDTKAFTQDIKIELEITKDEKDLVLKKISKFFAEKGITVNFNGIERNANEEIIAINVNYDNGAGAKGNYSKKQSSPINPFKILVNLKNEEDPEISIVERSTYTAIVNDDDLNTNDTNKSAPIYILEGKIISQQQLSELEKVNNIAEIKVLHDREAKKSYGIDTSGDIVIITTKDPKNHKRLIYLDGKRISEKEMGEIPSDQIVSMHVINKKNTNNETIMITTKKEENIIITDKSHADRETKIISHKIYFGDNNKNIPLLYLNGEKSNEEEFNKINQDDIESMNILEGKAARKKYGKKGKNGVVEITTKKKK